MAHTVPYEFTTTLSAATLGLNGVALNAAKTSNRFTVTGYVQLELDINHTNSSATAISWYFEHSPDAGTTWMRLQSGALVSGTETLSDHTVTKSVSASDTFAYLLPCGAYDDLRVVFSSTGGDANDTVAVTCRLGVQ